MANSTRRKQGFHCKEGVMLSVASQLRSKCYTRRFLGVSHTCTRKYKREYKSNSSSSSECAFYRLFVRIQAQNVSQNLKIPTTNTTVKAQRLQHEAASIPRCMDKIHVSEIGVLEWLNMQLTIQKRRLVSISTQTYASLQTPICNARPQNEKKHLIYASSTQLMESYA